MAMNDYFLVKLKAILSQHQIIDDITRMRAFGTDASFYQLIPKLVLVVETEEQMQAVISLADDCSVPILSLIHI